MSPRHQKGAQAVEFALVLPFLVLIIFAVIDFGILVYNKAIITNATREAARRATVLTAAAWDPASIRQVACDYSSPLISLSAGTRTATCTGTADPVVNVLPAVAPAFNTPITVTVSYTVTGFSLGSWYSLGVGPSSVGSPFTLTASTQMNHE